MENLAHTLLGLSLAKGGLERATPLATTALVISSNLPDIDVLGQLRGGTASYLQYHRGFTHGFVGLAILAVGLTILLMFVDRRFRLRRDPFRRPLRPFRIFFIAYLGGLGHTFMDFTNAYGVRPLIPFSNRWLYGDLAFVVDPWIWLILGSAVVWLTTTDAARSFFWLAIGIILSLIVALALRNPNNSQAVAVPTTTRVVWFIGLAVILAGTLLRWGRAGERIARYALLVLALYYCGMWMIHKSAIREVNNSLNVEGVTSVSAWPAPANPLVWQAVARTNDAVYLRTINLSNREGEWRELPVLDPKLDEVLRTARDSRVFLDFLRYGTATSETRGDGTTVVSLRDLRFDLRLRAEIDQNGSVTSAEVRWF